jgi:hypothetical protein
LFYAKTATRPVLPTGPTKPITDWSDRFLSQKWLFAKGLPLPDIDSARAIARDQAKQIAEGASVGGRPTMQLSRGRLEELLELAATSGARFTVEHYAVIDAHRSTLSARWRRGLFRLWCAVSALWLVFIIIVAAIQTSGQQFPAAVAIAGLGVPLAILVASIIVIKLSIWVANGFRGGP